MSVGIGLAGCTSEPPSSSPSSAGAPTSAPTAATEQFTAEHVAAAVQRLITEPVRVTRTATSNRPGEPPIDEIGYQGHVDVAGGKGSLVVDLSSLNEAFGEAPKAMPTEVDVQWQGGQFWLGSQGQYDQSALSDAAETGGALGAIPASVNADLALLSKAVDFAPAAETAESRPGERSFQFRLNGDSGQPQLQSGTVWLSDAGVPLRATFAGEGRSIPALPVRQHVMTLTFSELGEPFRVSQAG